MGQRGQVFLAMGVSALVLAVVPAPLAAQEVPQDSVARLWAQGVVQNRERTTEGHNDSLVQAIEHRIHCTCGCNLDVYTCRTTDFTCGTSPAMHRSVVARMDSALAAGFSGAQLADSVVARFELQYGQSVLMAPPRRGFNWTAYIMPFVGLGLGLALVAGLMRRWMRSRPAAAEPAATAPAGVPGVSDEELARLHRELEHFEA